MTGRWDELIWICERAEAYEVASLKDHKSSWVANWVEFDTYNAGEFAYRAGWLYSLRGQTMKLISASERVARYWQNAGLPNQAAALRLRGLGYLAQDDYSTARETFRDALRLWQRIKIKSKEVAVVLHDLAKVDLATGNYDDAEQYLNQALEISIAIGNQEEVAAHTGTLQK